MKRIVPLLIVFVFFILLFALQSSKAFSTPPSDIDLKYDTNKHVLHIVITHVTHKQNKHHIREVMVYLNEKKVFSDYYTKQTTGSEHVVDVPLEAKKDDTVRVEAKCTDSGPREATLVIP